MELLFISILYSESQTRNLNLTRFNLQHLRLLLLPDFLKPLDQLVLSFLIILHLLYQVQVFPCLLFYRDLELGVHLIQQSSLLAKLIYLVPLEADLCFVLVQFDLELLVVVALHLNQLVEAEVALPIYLGDLVFVVSKRPDLFVVQLLELLLSNEHNVLPNFKKIFA